MHQCGVMTGTLCTQEIYIISIHHQSMVMYAFKWKVLTSWSQFSTREHIDTHPHRETLISMISHRVVLLMKTLSYIFSSLFAWQVTRDDSSTALLHYALYMNNGHVPWLVLAEESWKLTLDRCTWLFSISQQLSRAMMTHRGGIYFWNTIPLAHLFLCSAAPIQNYFSWFAFYTSLTCSATIGK